MTDATLLLVTVPILYFPERFFSVLPLFAIAALIARWLWRANSLGYWLLRSPIDFPMALFIFLLLPLSIVFAPNNLRSQFSIPRSYILVWNFNLLGMILVYSRSNRYVFDFFVKTNVLVGLSIALIAPLGISWVNKLSILEPIFEKIPSPLLGIFQGAESGFSPNQVAGALLYVLPLSLTVTVAEWRNRTLTWYFFAISSLIMFIIFVLLQSRAALLGLLFAIVLILILHWQRYRRLIVSFAIISLVTIPAWFVFYADQAGLDIDSAEQARTIISRQEIWLHALYGIQDFPLTGLGLGTFRKIAPILYPFYVQPIGFDIAHAHNFFLQNGLDFGIMGLINIIALYILMSLYLFSETYLSEGSAKSSQNFLNTHAIVVGLWCSLIAQIVYGQFDAVSMGAKPNFLFWWYMALVFSVGEKNANTWDRLP